MEITLKENMVLKNNHIIGSGSIIKINNDSSVQITGAGGGSTFTFGGDYAKGIIEKLKENKLIGK